jgi:hypothetical protein
MCSGSCDGFSDRLKGIPLALTLAVASGRQFVVHPSYIQTGSPGERIEHKYRIVDQWECRECQHSRGTKTIQRLLADEEEEVAFYCNCGSWRALDMFMSGEGALGEGDLSNYSHLGLRVTGEMGRQRLDDKAVATIEKIKEECQPTALCGAAAVHLLGFAEEGLRRAAAVVSVHIVVVGDGGPLLESVFE